MQWVSLGGGIHFTGEGYPLDRFSERMKAFAETYGSRANVSGFRDATREAIIAHVCEVMREHGLQFDMPAAPAVEPPACNRESAATIARSLDTPDPAERRPGHDAAGSTEGSGMNITDVRAVSLRPTEQLFRNPQDSRTEAYITGRFG